MFGCGQVAMLAVLVSTAVVGTLHRTLDGAVLSSRPITVLVFFAALAACAGVGRHVNSRQSEESVPARAAPDRVAWGVATCAALLVLATYWGGEVGIGGDYRMHRMYAYQLLNGFPEVHEPYRGVPGHYPFLVHALLTVVVAITGLTVHYAMLVVSGVVSFGVALTAHRVAVAAGLSPLAARFFAALLVLWGGAWVVELRSFQLFLPAVQLAMPFLSRNLALLLLLSLIEIVLCNERGAAGRRPWRGPSTLAVGLLVGLLGLTRPWEFGFGMLALLALTVTHRSRAALAAIALASLLSAAYWLPLVLDWFELGIHAEREVARSVDWPTSPSLYLPLLPWIALAVLDWRSMPAAIRASGLTLLALFSLPLVSAGIDATGIAAALGLQGGLLKLERIGQVLALCVFALAAFGLERSAKRWGRVAAASAGIAFALVGLATTLRATGYFLDGGYRFPSPRWSREAHYVFDLAGSPFYLRHLLDDPRSLVLAPSSYGHLTASRNGVEVAYSHQAAPIWQRSTAGAKSAEQRRRAVDAFYEKLKGGAVDGRSLAAFGARYFVWTQRAPETLPNISHIGEIGEFSGATWHLLRVEPSEPR